MFQNETRGIKCSKYGVHGNVKIISFHVSSNLTMSLNKMERNMLTYGIPAQDNFRKISTSINNPDRHKETLRETI